MELQTLQARLGIYITNNDWPRATCAAWQILFLCQENAIQQDDFVPLDVIA